MFSIYFTKILKARKDQWCFFLAFLQTSYLFLPQSGNTSAFYCSYQSLVTRRVGTLRVRKQPGHVVHGPARAHRLQCIPKLPVVTNHQSIEVNVEAPVSWERTELSPLCFYMALVASATSQHSVLLLLLRAECGRVSVPAPLLGRWTHSGQNFRLMLNPSNLLHWRKHPSNI